MDNFGQEPLSENAFVLSEERRQETTPSVSTSNSIRVDELFARRAVETPGAVAVQADGESMTYAELDAATTRVASLLRARGAGRGTFIGLAAERSIDTIIALLAILKSGAAYVPLDLAASPERIEAICVDAGIDLVVTPSRHAARFGRRAYVPESAGAHVDLAPSADTPDESTPAYVIYTSGSTGTPKGVVITHGGLANYISAAVRRYAVTPQDRVLQFSSLNFDASIEEIFIALSSGATLVLRNDVMLGSLAKFFGTCDKWGITVLGLPTAFWHELVERLATGHLRLFDSLRLVIIGGEKARAADVAAWRAVVAADDCRLFNTYGPAEATIVATMCDLSALDAAKLADAGGDSVPLGVPVDNVTVYVCDEHLKQVAEGESGEICIGGAGVGAGYLRRPELTLEKFVPDPFAGEPGARLYRTGDRGTKRNGLLYFLGRIDRQVKIRGFRVELEEVEETLQRHPLVDRAAVILHDERSTRRLAACVTPDRDGVERLRPALEAERIAEWRVVHDNSVTNRAAATLDPALNFEGWSSSYTGLRLPDAEMREWADATATRISARLPQQARVLEVGCGTGLLLFRHAHQVKEYTGTDFSRGALDYLRDMLATRPGAPRNVSLFERTADALDDFASESFDAVILNSVVQYFPSAGYLRKVVEGAMRLVAPGGLLFVGDVRSYPLMELFHTTVALNASSSSTDPRQVRAHAARLSREEEELLLAPRVFIALATEQTSFDSVQVEPRGGRARNEMTQFRYDVTFRRNPVTKKVAEWVNWQRERPDLAALRRLVEEHVDGVGLLDIDNARLAPMIAAAAKLTGSGSTSEAPGLDPADLRSLGAELGYAVVLSWAEHDRHGRFDVAFVRAVDGEPEPFVVFPPRDGRARDGASNVTSHGTVQDAASNDPLWQRIARRVAGDVRSFLPAQLPEYAIPSDLVVLPSMPLTTTGKIDYAALPAPDPSRPALAGDYVAPRNDFEERTARVWQEALGIEQVGVEDDFFVLGGNSLVAIQLASRLSEEFETEVPLERIFRSTTVASLAATIAQGRGERAEAAPAVPSIVPVPRGEMLPVGFAQQAMWIASQMASSAVPYNNQVSIHLKGALSLDILSRALTAVVRRHEIFRTSFDITDEGVMQQIHEPWTVSITPVDLSHLSPHERQAEAERVIVAESRRPFDLRTYPLLRWTLLRLSEHEHILVQVDQHFGHDGWSLALLLRDLKTFYDGYARGETPAVSELAFQFADYAVWQRQYLQGDVLETELSYWRDKLEGASLSVEIPTDRPRPKNRTFEGATYAQTIPPALVNLMRDLSRREGVTLFMTMLAAFDLLLSRYTGQDDILIASAFANRAQPGTEQLIGMLANAVLLRGDLSGNPTFRELLRRTENEALAAYQHQALPFESLVEDYHHNRDNSRNPLFQVMFSFHDVDMPELKFGGIEGMLEYYYNGSAKFDLDVTVIPNFEQHRGLGNGSGRESMLIEWEYSTDLYDAATIARLAAQYETLLRAVAANPAQLIGNFSLLRDSERNLLIEERHGREVPEFYGRNVCDIFETHAERNGDRVAVAEEQRRATYAELNRRANRFAHALVERGVEAGTVVGIYAERGIDFLTAILGIWKAGAAYLPLDRRDPVERLKRVLRESGTRLVVATADTAPHLGELLRETADAPAILELQTAIDEATSEANPPRRNGSKDIAYVIFTSGSTGVPKGVMVEHDGMVNHLFAKIDELRLDETDVIAQTASQAFDISVWQFVAALLVGGRVEVLSDDVGRHPRRLLQRIAQNDLTVVETVPALLHAMLEEVELGGAPPLSVLRWMLVTAEPLLPGIVRRWLAQYPNVPVVNAYGPTECSDDVTHHVIVDAPAEDELSVPIGRPLPNVKIYILDAQLNLGLPGAVGEICVGGVCVGRGYFNDPARTALAFVPDPFSTRPGARLYRTGDLGRHLPDGTIQYLGRRDQQIKVRGFRIEIGEIEAVIAAHPLVREVAVKPAYNSANELHLVAYVALTEPGDTTLSKIRSALWEKLPEFMLPSFFVTVPALPRNVNGKIDREALPPIDVDTFRREEGMVLPRTPVEEVVAELWRNVLSMPAIGVHANFFELGGHSLLATQLLTRLSDRFNITLPLTIMFEAPTIARLAEKIDGLLSTSLAAGDRACP